MAPFWNDVRDVSAEALGRRLGISPAICQEVLGAVKAATGDAALCYNGATAHIVLGPRPYQWDRAALSITDWGGFVLISGSDLSTGIIPQSSITNRVALGDYQRRVTNSRVVPGSTIRGWVAERLATLGRPTFRA